jgi:hypothetical protein
MTVILSTVWALKPSQPAIQWALVPGGVFHPAETGQPVRPTTFCHIYVFDGAYFVWPWKSRAPHRDIVTSQRGHWPLLIRVSGITWRVSKLLETLTLVRVTYAHVWVRVAGWLGKEEEHTYCCYAYRLYFLTCDMYKSSLRHIHDPVLSSLKMFPSD